MRKGVEITLSLKYCNGMRKGVEITLSQILQWDEERCRDHSLSNIAMAIEAHDRETRSQEETKNICDSRR
jgi:hypothetical protein